MIDFIRIIKEIPDGKPLFTENLEWHKSDKKGVHYKLNNKFKSIDVRYDVDNSFIEIRGSLLYYIQGHNFTFNMDKFIEAVKDIGEKLNLNLWDSSVAELEFGVIIEVNNVPKTYILNHSPKQGEHLKENSKLRDKGKFKWWEDRSKTIIKMYDAGSNLKSKVSKQIRENINDFNPDLKYLKIETHYKKPHIVLNNGKDIKLYNLIMDSWIDRLKEDLLLQYGRFINIPNLVPPANKKEATTSSWILRNLYKEGLRQGKSPERMKKELYEELREYDTLELNDRKSRQAQFRNLNKKIKYESYDLTVDIIQAFNKSENCYKNNIVI